MENILHTNGFTYEIKNNILIKATGSGCAIIESGITTIESWAFYGCAGLTELSIPSGVTTIGLEAFRGCTELTELSIPSGVTTIGSWAFYGCAGLTELSIPSSVMTIGAVAGIYNRLYR
jgi:hypothetical protein